jgi:hypothetical protein
MSKEKRKKMSICNFKKKKIEITRGKMPPCPTSKKTFGLWAPT